MNKFVKAMLGATTALSLALATTGVVSAQPAAGDAKPAAAPAKAEGGEHAGHDMKGMKGGPAGGANRKPVGEPYPLETSAVSGDKLGAGAVIFQDANGREFRVNSEEEATAFKAAPEKFTKDVDAKIIEKEKGDYPLTTCVITGEKLGASEEMKPIDYVYNNRLVRFCCANCVSEFNKDPKTALKKINDAVIARDMPTYPTEKCMMMTDEEAERNIVVQNKLVRVCCGKCATALQKNPNKWLAKLDELKAADKAEHGEKPAAAAPAAPAAAK
ncbi:hypothetical protein BH09SUM1_BH09SUM1_03400 [soil metagenome]